MRFRKKPVEVEAWQWDGHSTAPERPEWLRGLNVLADHLEIIHTLEGPMAATKGDWIIRGTKGEIYPCKPDIFDDIYDRVGNADVERQQLCAKLRSMYDDWWCDCDREPCDAAADEIERLDKTWKEWRSIAERLQDDLRTGKRTCDFSFLGEDFISVSN